MTVDQFLSTHTLRVPGSKVRLTALYHAYQKQLPASERTQFTKKQFWEALDKLGVIRGLGSGSQVFCANITMAENQLVRKDNGQLVKVPRVDPLSEFMRTRAGMIQHD